jgi:zinc transporter 1
LFTGIAAVGLALNIFGTIIFAVVGISHGHSHSHGHGHGHGHGHKTESDTKIVPDEVFSKNADCSMLTLSPKGEDAALKSVTDAEHSHAHDNGLDHAHNHDHKHKDKSHKHSEIKEKKKKDHSHSHSDHKHDEEHSHGHDKKTKKKKKSKLDDMDMNTKAVFLHFLGDAISSLCVLGTGLILHFFSSAHWIKYLDPISSLIIVIIIISTTVPLVKRCSMILLQSVPSEVDLDAVTSKASKVDGVISVHDLHVWQLVDGMIIASVHLMLTEGADVGFIVYQVKQIFHSFGIHSSAIQPEFVKHTVSQEPFCAQNCVEECEADWCCKKTADKKKDLLEDYSTFHDV